MILNDKTKKIIHDRTILYFQGAIGYSLVHLINAKTKYFAYSRPLKVCQEKASDRFIRIHKGYLINLDHVQSFTENQVMINGKSLPISRRMKPKVLPQLKNL